MQLPKQFQPKKQKKSKKLVKSIFIGISENDSNVVVDEIPMEFTKKYVKDISKQDFWEEFPNELFEKIERNYQSVFQRQCQRSS